MNVIRGIRSRPAFAAIAAALVLVALIAGLAGGIGGARSAVPSSSPSVSPTEVAAASASPTAAVAGTPATTPIPTPAGTITEQPNGAAPSQTSVPVVSIAPATPTPPPTPGFWRLEGAVVDRAGNPVSDVCIAIGPHGCREFSPRTDARGVYFFDFPPASADYDLHFLKDGFQPFDVRVRPAGPQIFNVVLTS